MKHLNLIFNFIKRVHFANDTTHVLNEMKNEVKNKDELIRKLQQEIKTIHNEYECANKGVSSLGGNKLNVIY